MVGFQITPKTTLYIELIDDTQPNKGGYYCRVYKDNDKQREFCNFVIENWRVTGEEKEKQKLAYKFAIARIKNLWKK